MLVGNWLRIALKRKTWIFWGKVKSIASSIWFCSMGPDVGDKEIVIRTARSTYPYCKAKERCQEGEQSVPQGYLE